MDNKVNISVHDGEAFYCHEMSANFNPLQFILDFKSVTPRVDVRSKDRPSLVIKHNVVMMDPYHAKRMLELMTKVIEDYEKQFGKITKPKAVAAMEKKHKKAAKDAKSQPKTIEAPTYFG